MLSLRYNTYFVSNILSCDNIFRIFKFSTSACKCLQFTNVFDFAFYFSLETETEREVNDKRRMFGGSSTSL